MAWSAGQKYLAEFLGTFGLLVFGGGAAVFSNEALGHFPVDMDARVVLVSAAFGLTVLGMAYIFGSVSGGHFNPAVTFSMALNRRLPARDLGPYLLAQIGGGFVGMLTVAAIAHGSDSFWRKANGSDVSFGSQCYAGSGAPNGCTYCMGSVFLLEVVATFLFVLVIQLVTREDSGAKNLAPVAIGLTLMVTNLMAIPIDGASINPVRSFSPALVSQIWTASPWALGESWLFWIAPILGGLLAAVAEMAMRPKP